MIPHARPHRGRDRMEARRQQSTPAGIADIAERVAPRSSPRQTRSRDRQQALLDTAEELLLEVGLDRLSMRELARRADLPIASVYHYVPSAAAIVRQIAERQLQRIGAFLQQRLRHHGGMASAAQTPADLAAAIIDDLADFLAGMPAAAAIWNAIRSNPELRALDRADTEANAAALAPYLQAMQGNRSAQEASALAMIILEMVAVNLILALEAEAEQRALLLEALRTTMRATIRGLISSGDAFRDARP